MAANPTVSPTSTISWMSPSSVSGRACTASSVADTTSAAASPPRTPKQSAQASTAPGVQIEPITGASAASWAGVCTNGVLAITATVTATSAIAIAPRRPDRAPATR